MLLRFFALLASMLTHLAVVAQLNQSSVEYIQAYRQLAMEEMVRTGVPAAITLAQGILESRSGQSELVTRSNNHFGIKCRNDWMGERVYHDDDEKGECFRSYPTAEQSYKDHSDFLRNSSRYAALFSLAPEDYQGWAYGLKKAGYATDPKYAQLLIKLIDDYGLQQYTLIALNKISPDAESLVGAKGNTGTYNLIASGPSDEKVDASANIHNEEMPVIDYPAHAFKINDTRVVFVRKGTSLLALAQEHAIPLARLLDFNDLQQIDILPADQLLFLQRKRKQGATPYHITQRGETLYTICQSEGIRLESLLEYNRLSADASIRAGQKIYLQPLAKTDVGLSL